jgi:polysaccharide biosynthesis/export protein
VVDSRLAGNGTCKSQVAARRWLIIDGFENEIGTLASRTLERMISRKLKLAGIAICVTLSGCSALLSSSGPAARQVVDVPPTETEAGVRVVDLSGPLVQRMLAAQKSASLAQFFGAATPPKNTIGAGDSLEIAVWEAPPAALFSGGTSDPRVTSSSTRVPVLPEQTVNGKGEINMPFAGTIKAAGMTTEDLEKEIARRLKGKANDPQVLVRMLRNSSSMVTVVGEVTTSSRLPLSPRGERLLDALAASGGFRQPVGKITIQITREVVEQGQRTSRVVSLPLNTLITDPAQNIILQPGDVITALFQPNSFTVLGATAKNEEISFEAQGISLAQALARSGGLLDNRANAMGVFLFRFEDPAIIGETAPARTTLDGKVPVIYRVDLKDPASFFLAQNFPVHNKDMLYVANAPLAELQKFVSLLSGIVLPVLTVDRVLN